MTRWSVLLLILLPLYGFCQNETVKDLTDENLFTKNIEGPNIDSKGNFYVVNFQKDGTIARVLSDGSVEFFAVLPEGSVGNAIMFDKKENLLVADFGNHNVLRIDKSTKKTTVYSHNAFTQPNDMCMDKKGQLFLSDPDWKGQSGRIWFVDLQAKAKIVKSEMGTTNGIELSPDGKTLYVNESIQQKIWAFSVGDDGALTNQRLLMQFDDYGLDGMKCDVKGNIYVTRWGKGTVLIITPDGKVLKEITLKGKNCSNLTFGGSDGKNCYVTMQDRKCIEWFRAEFPGAHWR